jgi:hypothetical protein
MPAPATRVHSLDETQKPNASTVKPPGRPDWTDSNMPSSKRWVSPTAPGRFTNFIFAPTCSALGSLSTPSSFATALRSGYHFQIIGDPAEDLLVLLGRLIAKIRRALSVKHLVDGELGLQIGDNRVVQGMVESDRDYDGRAPLLIIDGREVTWDEFGHMLMSFEGWCSN